MDSEFLQSRLAKVSLLYLIAWPIISFVVSYYFLNFVFSLILVGVTLFIGCMRFSYYLSDLEDQQFFLAHVGFLTVASAMLIVFVSAKSADKEAVAEWMKQNQAFEINVYSSSVVAKKSDNMEVIDSHVESLVELMNSLSDGYKVNVVLDNTNTTDYSLNLLEKIKGLNLIRIANTKMSDVRIEQFIQDNPNVEVIN